MGLHGSSVILKQSWVQGRCKSPSLTRTRTLPMRKTSPDLTWPEPKPRWLQTIRQESRGLKMCSFPFHGWPPEKLRKTAPLHGKKISRAGRAGHGYHSLCLLAKGCADLYVLTWCVPAKSWFVIIQSAVTWKKWSVKRQELAAWQPQKKVEKQLTTIPITRYLRIVFGRCFNFKERSTPAQKLPWGRCQWSG